MARWLGAGGLVAGGWWLVAGGWWLVAEPAKFKNIHGGDDFLILTKVNFAIPPLYFWD